MARKRNDNDQDGGVATLPPPERNPEHEDAEARHASSMRGEPIHGACVGLPVQFHTLQGPVPGVLSRQSLTDQSIWDVKIIPSGASIFVVRTAVRHSDEPRPGCWTFLPGFGG